MDLDAFHALPRLGQFAVSPSGDYAVASVAALSEDGSKRVAALWKVHCDSSKPSTLLLQTEQSLSAPSFDSQGRLYFLSKAKTPTDDTEQVQQLWCLNDEQQLRVLTDEPLGVKEYRIAGDVAVVLCPILLDTPLLAMREQAREQEKNGPSARLYQTMPVRSWDCWTQGQVLHFVRYSLVGNDRLDLTPEFHYELASEHGLVWDLSGDGRQLATNVRRPGPDRLDDTGVLLIDTASGSSRKLGWSPRVTHEGLRFSPDAMRLAATRHIRAIGSHGAVKLVVYDCQSGEERTVAKDWDIVPTLEAWHGQDALVVTAPSQGNTSLCRVELASSAVRTIGDEGSYAAAQVVDDIAWGIYSSFQTPPELFYTQLRSQDAPRIVSTFSGPPKTDLEILRRRIRGADDTPVDYFLLRRPEWNDQAMPTLIWIHGGPVSSWVNGWHWRWNPHPFLAAGYQVALPNPRGSTGYGQPFIEEICNNQWGAACYHDVMAVTDDLAADPFVNAEKIAAMGGSFGGYMSNWIGTQTDRFAAIITHASVYRFSSFHGTTDYPAFWALHMGLYPSDNEAEYNRYSPHLQIDNWKTPVLIIHGEKDYRVPISESLMLFEDLQRRNVSSELLVFPDENHWIVKPRNSHLWYQSCLEFLGRELAH